MPSPARGTTLARMLAAGAAAGAAGTAALDAVTYLDMAVRGRPASRTPEQTVTAICDRVGLRIPGRSEIRDNRIAGLAPLLGIGAGVAGGVALGWARALGWRPGPTRSALAATATGLLVGNVPMTITGVTDPRRWSWRDWVIDVVPHLAYGSVTGAVLAALDA